VARAAAKREKCWIFSCLPYASPVTTPLDEVSIYTTPVSGGFYCAWRFACIR